MFVLLLCFEAGAKSSRRWHELFLERRVPVGATAVRLFDEVRAAPLRRSGVDSGLTVELAGAGKKTGLASAVVEPRLPR